MQRALIRGASVWSGPCILRRGVLWRTCAFELGDAVQQLRRKARRELPVHRGLDIVHACSYYGMSGLVIAIPMCASRHSRALVFRRLLPTAELKSLRSLPKLRPSYLHWSGARQVAAEAKPMSFPRSGLRHAIYGSTHPTWRFPLAASLES